MTRSESRIIDAAIRRGERVGGVRVLGLLRARLGALGALAVLAEVAGQALRGEPFRRRLGPTRDLRDRRSRRQCTSLVLLDRALRRRIGADASHLAPLFCEADNLFFDGGRRGVRLERSETLASGGRRCDFRFTIAEAATDEAPEV